jgi:NIMA-interacting peptidyl-prolyl cis-trans isomerase 4
MAPKGKGAADKGGAAKGKGKGKTDEKEEKGGKVKASQFVNVRHILVQLPQSRKRDRMYI